MTKSNRDCDCEDGCFLDQPARIAADTNNELFDELRALTDRLLVHRSCFFVIDDPVRHRYVQARVDGDAVIVVESVSNESLDNCCEEHCLSPIDESRLLSIGWRPPDDGSPNWHRIFVDPWPWPAPVAAELLVRTLVEIHKSKTSDLEVRVDRSPDPCPRIPVGGG